MGPPSLGVDSFQLIMTLRQARATEEFLTFVSGSVAWGDGTI
jgi:hypothetical protein